MGVRCETVLYPHPHPTPQTRLPFPSSPNTLARNLLVRLFLAELRPSLEIFAALRSVSPSQTCMCTRSWILAALIPQLRQKTKGLPSCCEVHGEEPEPQGTRDPGFALAQSLDLT